MDAFFFSKRGKGIKLVVGTLGYIIIIIFNPDELSDLTSTSHSYDSYQPVAILQGEFSSLFSGGIREDFKESDTT